uniref:Rad21/Rec8-like protein C-terminal eukaryotic domain-containing protein n=1 Tax=Kalanchoe fedtschenkoi TaxID=63787 RepID=A0A7N0TAV7_KALFE
MKVPEPQTTVILPGNSEVINTADAESVDDVNQPADPWQQVQANHSGLNEKTESSITKHGNEVSFHPPLSEVPAPEKLLSMPEGHSKLPTDVLPDTTPEKTLLADDEDGTGVITGQKRSFTESTLTADSLHTAESCGKDRLKKTVESIPDDEDLLSSILVGRRSSILKLKPTPIRTEVVSLKRPRSRSITYKRKVLMDDNMVLHGDSIREQLVTTEDIRRVRRKAPCTRQEIWMIQKQFLEEDIVYDPVSTGMSMELVCLHNHAYELSGISITRVDEPMNQMDSTTEMHPHEKDIILDTQECGVAKVNGEIQIGTASFQTENQPGEGDTSCASHENSELQKGASSASLPLASSLKQGQVSEMEVDGESCAVVEAAAHASPLVVECSSPACLIPADIPETAADCAIPLPDETNDCSNVNCEASSLDQSNEAKVDHSHLATIDDRDGSPLHVKPGILNKLSLNEAENGGSVEDTELSRPLTAPEMDNYDIGLDTDTRTLENCDSNVAGPSLSVDHDINLEKLSLSGAQNENSNEFDELQRQTNGTTDAESAVIEDYADMNYMTAEHDTGFLNVDDDDLEEDESYMPSVEESRTSIVDNSGWSSRSRAVGKYLQIMFDKEAEHGNNVIPMNNLLTGKSRKEASRMFFETLVLKTRDYIQVEQTTPFNNINLRPQSMLMKSDL